MEEQSALQIREIQRLLEDYEPQKQPLGDSYGAKLQEVVLDDVRQRQVLAERMRSEHDAKLQEVIADDGRQQQVLAERMRAEYDAKLQEVLAENERQKQLLAERMRAHYEVKLQEVTVENERQRQELGDIIKAQCASKLEEVAADRDGEVALLKERLEGLEAEKKMKEVELSKKDSLILALRDEVLDLRGNFRVFARIRPTTESAAVVMQDDQELLVNSSVERYNGPRRIQVAHTFDRVIGPGASNEDVFLEMESLARSACKGHDVTVFAYGATNSGKTFTMFGGDTYESRGVVPRVVETIFDTCKAEESSSVSVELSCQEIYLEKVIDLLTGKVCETAHRQRLSSAEDCSLLQTVKKRRTSATNMNQESSRSHLIVQLFVKTTKGKKSTSGVVNLVDLAGSENFEAERNAEQKEEGSKIRTSLLSLERVLRDLKTKTPSGMVESRELQKSRNLKGHKTPSGMMESGREPSVSYRDSKLTYFLKDSLSRGKVLMFLNISPEVSSLTETKNSLRFAEFVQKIHIGQSKASVLFQ